METAVSPVERTFAAAAAAAAAEIVPRYGISCARDRVDARFINFALCTRAL